MITHIPLNIVLGALFVVLFGIYRWKQRQNNIHNATQLTIYYRIAQQLTDALSSEDLSWNEYVLLMNGLRETHNERLKGSHINQYKMPLMTTLNSMKSYNDGTNRPVFNPPRRTAPIRRQNKPQGGNNA